MRRNRWVPLFIILLLLPLTPPSSASGGRPISADGPDADGAYNLTFEVVRALAGSASVSLDIERTDADGTTLTRQDIGVHAFPVGSSLFHTTYLPTAGAGSYQVSLLVQGQAGDPLAFNVTQGDGTSARITYEIPDEPTHLDLTADSVNSDGKLKSPGEPLVTRAHLGDDNGWADLSRVDMRIDRQIGDAWAWFEQSTLPITAAADATEVPLEVEYARAPLAAGAYRLSLLAIKNDSTVAELNRTFVIREILPRLEAPTLANVSPDGTAVETSIVVTDRNGFADERIEARVYRGSTRVEESGFAVDLAGAGPTARIVDVGTLTTDAESARAHIPLHLTVPLRADAGNYRTSLYVNETLVGSMAFVVLELPDWVTVNVDETDDALTVEVTATGNGFVTLQAGAGAAQREARAHLVDGVAVLTLDRPAPDTSVPWVLSLRASDGGPVVSERSGWWNRSVNLVPLTVQAVHVSARLPAIWTVGTTPDWELQDAEVNVTVHRWDGTLATTVTARYANGRVRVDGPANVEPGRYQVQLNVTLPNGSRGSATWHVEAGPWIRLDMGSTQVTGREARINITNAGGVAVDRFIVEIDGAPPNATLAWEAAGETKPLTRRGPRHHADGLALAPTQTGALVVRLPEGPLPAGSLAIHVRLLALRS